MCREVCVTIEFYPIIVLFRQQVNYHRFSRRGRLAASQRRAGGDGWEADGLGRGRLRPITPVVAQERRLRTDKGREWGPALGIGAGAFRLLHSLLLSSCLRGLPTRWRQSKIRCAAHSLTGRCWIPSAYLRITGDPTPCSDGSSIHRLVLAHSLTPVPGVVAVSREPLESSNPTGRARSR